MNLSAVKTSPKAAPKPGSWAFAEDYVDESEQSAEARQKAEAARSRTDRSGLCERADPSGQGGAGEDGC